MVVVAVVLPVGGVFFTAVWVGVLVVVVIVGLRFVVPVPVCVPILWDLCLCTFFYG